MKIDYEKLVQTKKAKISISISSEVNDFLGEFTETMGVSKSALITEALQSAMPAMKELLKLKKLVDKGEVPAEKLNSFNAELDLGHLE